MSEEALYYIIINNGNSLGGGSSPFRDFFHLALVITTKSCTMLYSFVH